MKKHCIWILLLVSTSPVHAGEVVLTNGDRLSGELRAIANGKLVWQSDSVGEVNIALDSLQSLVTATAVAHPDLTGPCQITSLADGALNYRCTNGDTGSLALATLGVISPYVDPNLAPVSYRGKLTAAGRRRSGNSEDQSLSIDSETTYRRGDHRHRSKIDFDSLEDDNSDNSGDKLVLRHDYDWFFRDRWYWYNGFQGEYDEPADIESRYRYGTGVGFQVWDSDNSALALESGISYVQETEEEPLAPAAEFEATSRFSAWQWNLDYRKILFGKAEFFHKHQMIRSLEESEDWTLETETGISAPFIGTLYGELKVDYDVDNNPADDKRRDDTQINIGLGYSW